ncbi:MAG: putative DNA binding domain-containing protein [Candidatus Delongbacteria bacterium]|jgi:predicted HTH transcriptional regulator|nr:putative DNA binding domain-containing protein [Candidatus Delongbacteria bacterium]
MNSIKSHNLDMILQLGEGQYVEFKESLDKSLSKEIVAFANASGGVIYLGITDKGELLFPKEEFGKRSEARNRLLSDLLSRTEFMEKAGTGIKRVRDACKANSNKVEFDFTDAFWTVIHTNITTRKDTQKDLAQKDLAQKVSPKNAEILLEIIKLNNKITIAQMVDELNMSKRSIIRLIDILKNENRIQREGSLKYGHWKVIENN